MSDHELRAQVTLTPLGADNDVSRHFTLNNTDKTIIIGRSSKRGLKNRLPHQDNGWFDSRVMSRDHAELLIQPGKMILNINDLGSTHGTWLNNNRLIFGEATPLFSGDILRFGVDVERGEDVFPALVVRCKVDWLGQITHDIEVTHVNDSPTYFEPRPVPSLRQTSTNTFCVPEDDSDVEEVTMLQSIPTYEETEETHANEMKTMVSPALTSSETHSIPEHMECQPGDPRKQLPPSFSNQTPLFTDKQYPPHIFTTDSSFTGGPSDYPRFGVKLYKDNWSSEVERELTKEFEESEDEDSSEIESDSDSSSIDEDDCELNDLLLSSTKSDGGSSVDSASDADYNSDAESPFDDDSASNDSHDSDDGSFVEENEKECIDPTLIYNEFAASNVPTVPALPTNANVGSEPKSDELKHLHDLHVRFPKCPITSLLNCPPSQTFNQGDVPKSCDSINPHQPILEFPGYVPSLYRDGPFSCGGQVDKETNETEWGDMPKVSLKRKAFEMETQDAQLPELIAPLSQEPSLNSIQQSQVTTAISSALSEAEPPSKRVKSSPSSNLATYTATAVVSALLGGLGTIALLAALPAEYFQ
ncbi:hypothetical protein N7507_011104 [Penicillium longicatenatum]|nr:hypothetical protein N7507_011104 [Penicillium longicatenatum]